MHYSCVTNHSCRFPLSVKSVRWKILDVNFVLLFLCTHTHTLVTKCVCIQTKHFNDWVTPIDLYHHQTSFEGKHHFNWRLHTTVYQCYLNTSKSFLKGLWAGFSPLLKTYYRIGVHYNSCLTQRSHFDYFSKVCGCM